VYAPQSTLLSRVTHTASETAAYEFTTLTVSFRKEGIRCETVNGIFDQAIPGVIEYKGARIQLLDLPGIVEGASQGRGRGRQVVSTAKTADLILMMLDATKSEEQRRLLEIELDAVGIRLNKRKPDVVFKRKTTGGVRHPKPARVSPLMHIFFCRSQYVFHWFAALF
jgi:small GTP-binding protein